MLGRPRRRRRPSSGGRRRSTAPAVDARPTVVVTDPGDLGPRTLRRLLAPPAARPRWSWSRPARVLGAAARTSGSSAVPTAPRAASPRRAARRTTARRAHLRRRGLARPTGASRPGTASSLASATGLRCSASPASISDRHPGAATTPPWRCGCSGSDAHLVWYVADPDRPRRRRGRLALAACCPRGSAPRAPARRRRAGADAPGAAAGSGRWSSSRCRSWSRRSESTRDRAASTGGPATAATRPTILRRPPPVAGSPRGCGCLPTPTTPSLAAAVAARSGRGPDEIDALLRPDCRPHPPTTAPGRPRPTARSSSRTRCTRMTDPDRRPHAV